MIANQSAQLGFNEIFHLLGIIFLLVIAFVWIAKPPFAAKLGPAAAGRPPGLAARLPLLQGIAHNGGESARAMRVTGALARIFHEVRQPLGPGCREGYWC